MAIIRFFFRFPLIFGQVVFLIGLPEFMNFRLCVDYVKNDG